MAPDTALDRIQRILQIVPLAAREDGIGYDELADRLGIDRRDLERHLAELTERAFYQDPGAVEDLQILLDDDRVRIWSAGPLRRPVRLTPGEAAALDLGLRILAAEREEPELVERMRELLGRVAWTAPDDVLERYCRRPGDEEELSFAMTEVVQEAVGMEGRSIDTRIRWGMGPLMRRFLGRLDPNQVRERLQRELSAALQGIAP